MFQGDMFPKYVVSNTVVNLLHEVNAVCFSVLLSRSALVRSLLQFKSGNYF